MSKKLLASILVLVMILAMLPTAALADDEVYNGVTVAPAQLSMRPNGPETRDGETIADFNYPGAYAAAGVTFENNVIKVDGTKLLKFCSATANKDAEEGTDAYYRYHILGHGYPKNMQVLIGIAYATPEGATKYASVKTLTEEAINAKTPKKLTESTLYYNAETLIAYYKVAEFDNDGKVTLASSGSLDEDYMVYFNDQDQIVGITKVNLSLDVTAADGLVGMKGEDGTITITGAAGGTAPSGSGVDTSESSTNKVVVNASQGGDDATADATVNIPADTAATMEDITLTVKADDVTVELDSTAMKTVADAEDGVVIKVKNEIVGEAAQGETAPGKVVDVTVAKATGDGDKNLMPSSGNGKIKITLPKSAGEFVYNVIKNSGSWVPVEKINILSSTDTTITIEVEHLSYYAQYAREASIPEAMIVGTGTTGTLSEMITQATTGQTVKLLSDVTLNERLDIGTGDFTIDGNGKTISAAEGITNPSSATGSAKATKAMIRIYGSSKVAFQNVILDANEQARVLFCTDTAEVTLGEGTKVQKGQADVTSQAVQSCGGVVATGHSKVTVDGAIITDNKGDGTCETAGSEYLKYADDLWVGSDAEATIESGTVGYVLVNANGKGTTTTEGGSLNVNGGTVKHAFIEAQSESTGKLVAQTGGVIEELAIALDYAVPDSDNDGERVVATAQNVTATGENKVEVAGLEVPAGIDAVASGKYLSSPITIGEGATLLIPDGVNVTVKKNGEFIPAIANDGELIVDGSLLAEDGESTEKFLNITGDGNISGSGDIDLDPDEYVTVVVILKDSHSIDTPVEYKVKPTDETVTDEEGNESTIKIVPISFTAPNRSASGYTFKGWKVDGGDDTYQAGEEVSRFWNYVAQDTTYGLILVAQWERVSTPSVNPGGPGTSPVTVNKATNGKVEVNPQNAAVNATVTVTVTPDKGYVVDTVKVVDKDGKTVTVTKGRDNTYTFKMPAGGATVTATFKKDDSTGISFTDVKSGDWFFNAVKYVYDNKLMDGTSTTTFSPSLSVNRAQVAQVIYNMYGRPNAAGLSNPFTDVASGQWYTDAVLWCNSRGYMSGYGAGKFGPNDNVTREQLALVFMNVMGGSGRGDLSGFNDAGKVDSWALAGMQWAVANGIISGKGNNMLDPLGTAMRSELAQILMNAKATVR